MSVTNSELADFRATRRTVPPYRFPPPAEPGRIVPPDDDRAVFRLIVGGLIVAMFVMIGLALYTLAQDVKHDAWAKQLVEECRAEGRHPIVDRDVADKVLGVRCQP